MLFVQRIIETFFHVSSETECNAVRGISYKILKGWSSLSVRAGEVFQLTELGPGQTY